MATNLKSIVEGQNKYCGPAVLSILTGKSTDECASVISSINGKYTIEGVYLHDMLKAIEKIGFKYKEASSTGTLYGTITVLARSGEAGIYLIMVPHHYIVLEVTDEGRAFICDNHTKEPINASSSSRLTQKVQSSYKVWRRPEPRLVSSKITYEEFNKKVVYINKEEEWQRDDEIGYENRKVSLGYIRFEDYDELGRIVDTISEVVGKD